MSYVFVVRKTAPTPSCHRYRFLAAGFLAVPLAGAFFMEPQAIDASWLGGAAQ